MIDNLDFGIIITLDYDKDERLYMAFNAVKTRAKTDRTYIVQPFVPGNTMRLVEDYGGIPQFKDSLHTAIDLNRGASSIVKISGASSMTESMNLSVSGDMIDSDNTFAKKSYVIDEEEKEPERKIIKAFYYINEDSGFVDNIKLDIGNIEELIGEE